MNLKLNRPIVFFDLETTGVNIVKDRIVEISILKVFPNGNKESKTWLVNPTINIPNETTNIHGITNEKVANEPTFEQLHKEIIDIISKAHVFVLPSKYEPWGVILHEIVSLGKPVLVSENVGSSYCFTKNGFNGFVFSHKKKNDFKYKMKKILELCEDDLEKMGKESVNLSKSISIERWVKTLNKIYD